MLRRAVVELGRPLATSIHQLESYASRRNRAEADAYVVSCAPLRFAFVDGGTSQSEPRWEGWTYEPAPEDTASPDGCRVPPLARGSTRWIGRARDRNHAGTVTSADRGGRRRRRPPGSRADHDVRELETTRTGTGAPVEVPEKNWSCGESSVRAGTIRRTRGGFTIDLAGTELLTCRQRRVSVAGAETLRVELPQVDESCKRSTWAKTGPQREVMECEGAFRAILARAPGVEHVTIDEDDCGDPAKVLRAIAADGAVRVVRRYAPRN